MKRPFGAHWLAFLGALTPGEGNQLTNAVRTASEEGCTLFELACNPINSMDAEETAGAVLAGGIYEVSYCRFYPDESFGDPLGDGEAFDKAVATFERDIAFIEALRSHGLRVKYITGPSCFVLGKAYDQLKKEVRKLNLLRFTTKQADLVEGKELTVCLEYLRPGEDNGVFGGVKPMIELLNTLDRPEIKFHADIFHMLECREDPRKVIRYAGKHMGYLHAHGSDRQAPGVYRLDGNHVATDTVNWHLVSKALDEAGYSGPVVPEPFGATIREQVPALGLNLPPAIDPRRYYHLAAEHLQHEGVI